jgi:hypothetical protein
MIGLKKLKNYLKRNQQLLKIKENQQLSLSLKEKIQRKKLYLKKNQ